MVKHIDSDEYTMINTYGYFGDIKILMHFAT